MDSILTSVKQYLGYGEDYKPFDAEITMHINSVFIDLTQIGIGPEEGFYIKDEYDIWSDFIPESNKQFESIKEYVFLNVKLLFDPPASASHIDAIERKIKKLEWRFHMIIDNPKN